MQANFIQKIAKGNPKDFQLQASAWSLYRRFLSQYIWRYKWFLLVGSSTIFGLSFLQLLTPQITRYVFDVVIPQHRYGQVPWIGVAILLIAATIGGLNFGRTYLLSIVGQRTLYDLRQDLYQHLQTLSLSFFENQRTGTLMTCVTKDVEAAEKLITTDAAEIVAETLTFITVVGYLFYADWRLTLLLLSTLPVMVLLSQFFGARLRSVYQAIRTHGVALDNHLQETIANIKLIKAFANEAYEVDRFCQHNQANRDANLDAVKLAAGFAPIIDVMNALGYIIVLSYGAGEVMHQRLTLGELTAFLAYLNSINQPVKRYSRTLHVLQKGATALERMFDLLDQDPQVKEKLEAIALPPLTGHLQFKQVTFAYPTDSPKPDAQASVTDQPIFANFSLEIQPGTTVALVGSSGAGKSTIANLTCRFYDPQQGAIHMDGYDLRDLKIASLRQQISLVSQETLLLHGTVQDNIAYGHPGVTQAEIETAATLAQAHSFIQNLPQGYATMIGERGIKLSGGQRQRLAIARALIKNPRFLILDEATAALDTESEHLIQQALQLLLSDRTCLVIAHRLSTIQQADTILVLEQGQVVESGTHDLLLKLGGRYAHLHALQFPQKLQK
ncbi:MAG: ABC transporter ATP-binding protein [Acaryochloris sp. SU_5_25]|nr:ABC transporter ATP-binding protein [Acaryochloris sp. SU_5_25]